ncbi:MAG: hypothetical protein AB1414_01200 [bacterium]
MTTKKCSKCNQWLSIENFRKDSSKKDGYYSVCKICEKVKRNHQEFPVKVKFDLENSIWKLDPDETLTARNEKELEVLKMKKELDEFISDPKGKVAAIILNFRKDGENFSKILRKVLEFKILRSLVFHLVY